MPKEAFGHIAFYISITYLSWGLHIEHAKRRDLK
jgi:hypothetical protein